MHLTPVVLCVDDDEDDRLFLREAILSHPQPFHIKEVNDGNEALLYLQNCRSQDELPCLIIMDMNMPRMNGRQAAQKIMETESFSKIPLAVFTTSSSEADKKYFESLGATFITKPFDYAVFKTKIAGLLSQCYSI